MTTVPSDVVKELAPTAKLRAAINLGNIVLAQGTDDAPRGITVDLARELARRSGLPLELVPFHGAGKVFEAVGSWDIAFLAIEPVRAAEIAFTAPYVIIEGVYVVPESSALKSVDDVDRGGIRIAVNKGSAYDLFLTRTLKNAELVRAEGIDGSHELFLKQKLDVLAGLKPRLVSDAQKLPGARVLDGQITGVQQACGTTKARVAGAKYLGEFIEEVKRSGLVAKTIDKHGVKGVNVAP
jgi:polar amino acid transport system substrate-binding protein